MRRRQRRLIGPGGALLHTDRNEAELERSCDAVGPACRTLSRVGGVVGIVADRINRVEGP
jgi:hypothetical protein